LLRAVAPYLSAAMITLLVVLAFVLWGMPLGWLANSAGDNGYRVLAGSRLSRGQALVAGSQVARWQWCPGKELTALCGTLTGNGSFVSGIFQPGFNGILISDMTLSGVSIAGLGVSALGPKASLAGEISRARIPWRPACLQDMVTMEAELTVSDMLFPSLRGQPLTVVVQGNGSTGVSVRGDKAWGDFELVKGMMQGTLELSADIVPASAHNLLRKTDSGYGVEISQRTPCQK
jgi:hypothetical protein